MNMLNRLAAASGGKAYLVRTNSANANSIDNVLDEISAELRSQYTIGYYPDHPPTDGKWHQVGLQTVNMRYVVRSGKEYFGKR